MVHLSRISLRPAKILAGLCILSIPVFIYLFFFLQSIRSFARTLKEHVVSELDLSPEYQSALNVSLHSVPCCDQALWEPTNMERSMELIPRVIHQTWKTETVPEGDWTAAHNQCLDLHRPENGWKHMFWTDETARQFIADKYVDFLPTYDGYLYSIQRVDSLRYFLLYHYGGVYIDLDVGCSRPMEAILKFPAFFPRTGPSGVSNDVIGSRKGHPFLKALMDALSRQGGKRRIGTKYSTVFFTTGPMFVNRLLASYWSSPSTIGNTGEDRVMILPANFYCETFASFFMHFPGSSWHGADAKVIGFIAQYRWLVILTSLMYLGYRMKRQLTLRTRAYKTKLGLFEDRGVEDEMEMFRGEV